MAWMRITTTHISEAPKALLEYNECSEALVPLHCIDIVITLIYHTFMTTIQIRTQNKTKKAAMKILEKLGLDLSTAINIYLVQIIAKKGIPFEILTENGMTPAEEDEILKEIAWAKKYGKRYSSAKEMHADILKE